MSDFLQNLRNNKLDKKYNNRRKYSNHNSAPYPTLEKRVGDDRRNKTNKKNSGNKENSVMLDSIKMLLEDISENQQELLLAEEKKVSLEEKKLAALENIATFIEKVAVPIQSSQQYSPYTDGNSPHAISHQVETIRKPGPSDRETIMEIITNMREEGATFNMIAQFLDKEDFPTFSGKGSWHAQTVHRLCQQMDANEI